MTGDPLLSLLADRLVADADRRSRWHDNPGLFAAECVAWPDGQSLTDYQAAVLASVASDRRVALRSPHGAGKTATAALTVLWFAVTRDAAGVDWKCITTAGAWRQLERYLWPEIRLWASRLRWDVIGREPFDGRSELLALNLKMVHGQAFAAASDDPQLLEGAHASSLLVVLDEAKSIVPGVWDAVEGAMSGTGEAFALATSTPGVPVGRFYDVCVRRPGLEDWRPRHVTLLDAVGAGRISQGWADQRAAQWGRTSAVYLNRVEGEFASSDEDGVIPLAWVEAAVDRWRDWDAAGRPMPAADRVVGVDVARSGADETVLATREGDIIVGLERHSRQDLMETTGQVAAKLSHPSHLAVVDVIGVGAGVVDRFREQQHRVVGFHASSRPEGRDRSGELQFLNARAEGWWRLRELLDPAYGSTICLPDDDLLVGDLCSPRWSMNSSGRVQVEGKDDIRRRLGRSPDAGDAVVMAFSVSSSGAGGAVVVKHRWHDAGSQGVGWGRWDPPARSDPSSALAEWAADGGELLEAWHRKRWG